MIYPNFLSRFKGATNLTKNPFFNDFPGGIFNCYLQSKPSYFATIVTSSASLISNEYLPRLSLVVFNVSLPEISNTLAPTRGMFPLVSSRQNTVPNMFCARHKGDITANTRALKPVLGAMPAAPGNQY